MKTSWVELIDWEQVEEYVLLPIACVAAVAVIIVLVYMLG